MLLVVDNGSIYTKQLTDFLTQKNFSFEKYTPDTLKLNSYLQTTGHIDDIRDHESNNTHEYRQLAMF